MEVSQPPTEVVPFRINIPDSELHNLRRRLEHTRWPEAETVPDWSQGVPLGYLRELCRYWAEGYDWRTTESRLNALPSSAPASTGWTSTSCMCAHRIQKRCR